MSARSLKAFRSIFLEGNFHRIWQILNKSPLVHVFAFMHGLARPEIKKARVQIFQSLTLSPEQKRIVEELQKRGFARVDTLYTAEDFEPLIKYLEMKLQDLEKARSQQAVHTKDFWVRLNDAEFTNGVTDEHPLVRLSLKEDILKVIAGYFKEAPFLEYLLLTYSLPSKQPLKASQLWHHDHDNDRMIKLFFYLSDVEKDEDGPFTLLSKEANLSISNSFFPRHLADAEINTSYSLTNAVQIKGRKFSAFLVDTSQCYHMGSRVAEGHSRLMSTSLYVTLPKSYWGPPKNIISLTQPVSPLVKAAVNCEFHGKS